MATEEMFKKSEDDDELFLQDDAPPSWDETPPSNFNPLGSWIGKHVTGSALSVYRTVKGRKAAVVQQGQKQRQGGKASFSLEKETEYHQWNLIGNLD